MIHKILRLQYSDIMIQHKVEFVNSYTEILAADFVIFATTDSHSSSVPVKIGSLYRLIVSNTHSARTCAHAAP